VPQGVQVRFLSWARKGADLQRLFSFVG